LESAKTGAVGDTIALLIIAVVLVMIELEVFVNLDVLVVITSLDSSFLGLPLFFYFCSNLLNTYLWR